MAELLDRGLQRVLLYRLADTYPGYMTQQDLGGIAAGNVLNVNIAYLGEHGLVESKFSNSLDDGPIFVLARITAKGIDFLQDDGGLGAILGVVTVRLHQDTVRQILIQKVEESDADKTVKGKLIDQLKALPAEGIGTLAEKALEAGLRALPNAVQLLQTALAG